MASLGITGLGNQLYSLLTVADIVPGDTPSYQVCKTIYAYHPMGAKIVDFPIEMAQSQPRKLAVPKGPGVEPMLIEAFEQEWEKLGVSALIANLARQARMYGVSSIALLSQGTPATRPVDFSQLFGKIIAFNVLDPLNTSGSLILDQDPNSMNFQKVGEVAVAGQRYHPSRTITLMNEAPIYIEYTSSAFGYVGRSVYQRGLFPLKSFINTMITDDMIALKAGVLIAKQKAPGSIIDELMRRIAGQKREMLKEAQTNNVLSIGTDEEIASLDLKNTAEPFSLARKNIIENIASACGTPAKILLAETFAEGFGEGTEDAKHVAQFIESIREWMDPIYRFFDKVVMYRAWNREFYRRIQEQFPDQYGQVGYTQAFYDWKNSFEASWPSLIEEPESEKVKVDDVRFRTIIAALEVLLPFVDPINQTGLVKWAVGNFNQFKLLFPDRLELDLDTLESFLQDQADARAEAALNGGMGAGMPAAGGGAAGSGGLQPVKPPKPFADSAGGKALSLAVERLSRAKGIGG